MAPQLGEIKCGGYFYCCCKHEGRIVIVCTVLQVSQVGEVLRALGTNPTEGEVKKLIQTTCTSVPSRAGNEGSRSFAIAKNLRDCETSSFVSSSSNQVLTVFTCNIRPT